MLDIKICENITTLIEKLATSGKDQIDKKAFKELARDAGQSEEYVKFCLERIFQHLEQKHSEIRLGAFLIVDLLFMRSHYFREILLDDFHTFLELTVESNPSKLLPLPLSAAKTLKQKTLQAIHKWHSKFGTEHQRLALSYNFLKNSLKVDFQDALMRNANELQSERLIQERQAKVVEKKVTSIKAEINENQEEIIRVVTEMNNCFCLLIPKPEEAFGQPAAESSIGSEHSEELSGTNKLDLREHGFQTSSTTIQFQMHESLGKIQETEDNSAILENLKDYYALLNNRFLAMIKKWVTIASKAVDQTLFRQVLDLKAMVEKEIGRFKQLQITNENRSTTRGDSNESEDDSDFEDVPEKPGYEAEAISCPVSVSNSTADSCRPSTSKRVKEASSWSLWDVQEEDAKDPTSLSATLKSITEKMAVNQTATNINVADPVRSSEGISNPKTVESTEGQASRKQKLLKIAPKLPFDIDLYHWEDKDLKAPSIEIVETDGHKFWTPTMDRAGETIDDPNGIASLRSRVIEFSGQFEPVKWSCRSPLPSGSLCPRQDRVKCPLHGKIIARDNMGNPTRAEDIAELEKIKEQVEQSKPPEWQDPEFLKDIQAETGMDLTIQPSKKGKKKKKTFVEMYPGLTNIDKKNTPRSRLKKKVFNKSAMKRVAGTLDDMNSKKFRDKFGDQWSYAMND